MKSKLHFSWAVIILLLIALSCKESVTPFRNGIRLLTNNSTKTWTVTSIEEEDPVTGLNCSADDILTIKLFDDNLQPPGPSYSRSEGFVRCNLLNDYELESGSWRLNNSETRIIFTKIFSDGDRINYLYDILELEERRMVLRYRNEFNMHLSFKTYTYESL